MFPSDVPHIYERALILDLAVEETLPGIYQQRFPAHKDKGLSLRKEVLEHRKHEKQQECGPTYGTLDGIMEALSV